VIDEKGMILGWQFSLLEHLLLNHFQYFYRIGELSFEKKRNVLGKRVVGVDPLI
jgi:hypothetical protein